MQHRQKDSRSGQGFRQAMGTIRGRYQALGPGDASRLIGSEGRLLREPGGRQVAADQLMAVWRLAIESTS
jgi:hypothetical protein